MVLERASDRERVCRLLGDVVCVRAFLGKHAAMKSVYSLLLLASAASAVKKVSEDQCHYVTIDFTWLTGSKFPNRLSEYQGDLDEIHPGARAGCLSGVIYDELFLLFGGWASDPEGSSASSELWLYNVTSRLWEMPRNIGFPKPVGRHSGHACVFNDELFIFGGFTTKNRPLNDTWIFKLSTYTWTKIPQHGPVARAEGVTWCTENAVYLYGGDNNVNVLSDFWKFDYISKTWTEIKTAVSDDGLTVGPRLKSSAWVDIEEQNLFLFGGASNLTVDEVSGLKNDLMSYNIKNNKWTLLSKGSMVNGLPLAFYAALSVTGHSGYPGGRAGAATWRDACGLMWMMSGQGYGEHDDAGIQVLSDLWMYNPKLNYWVFSGGFQFGNQPSVVGTKGDKSEQYYPGSRRAAVSLTVGTDMYMFGGLDQHGNIYNALWLISLEASKTFSEREKHVKMLARQMKSNTNASYIVMMGIMAGTFLMCIAGLVLKKLISSQKKQPHDRPGIKYDKLRGEA